jgi:hypothetical protein
VYEIRPNELGSAGRVDDWQRGLMAGIEGHPAEREHDQASGATGPMVKKRYRRWVVLPGPFSTAGVRVAPIGEPTVAQGRHMGATTRPAERQKPPKGASGGRASAAMPDIERMEMG